MRLTRRHPDAERSLCLSSPASEGSRGLDGLEVLEGEPPEHLEPIETLEHPSRLRHHCSQILHRGLQLLHLLAVAPRRARQLRTHLRQRITALRA